MAVGSSGHVAATAGNFRIPCPTNERCMTHRAWRIRLPCSVHTFRSLTCRRRERSRGRAPTRAGSADSRSCWIIHPTRSHHAQSAATPNSGRRRADRPDAAGCARLGLEPAHRLMRAVLPRRHARRRRAGSDTNRGKYRHSLDNLLGWSDSSGLPVSAVFLFVSSSLFYVGSHQWRLSPVTSAATASALKRRHVPDVGRHPALSHCLPRPSFWLRPHNGTLCPHLHIPAAYRGNGAWLLVQPPSLTWRG